MPRAWTLPETPQGHFNGDHGARDAILQAFNNAHAKYSDWIAGIQRNDKKDWASALKALKQVFGKC